MPVGGFLVGFVLVDLMFCCADVETFMLRNLVREGSSLLQCGLPIVVHRSARVQSFELTPKRHGGGGVEACGLFERTVGFEIPEVVE